MNNISKLSMTLAFMVFASMSMTEHAQAFSIKELISSIPGKLQTSTKGLIETLKKATSPAKLCSKGVGTSNITFRSANGNLCKIEILARPIVAFCNKDDLTPDQFADFLKSQCWANAYPFVKGKPISTLMAELSASLGASKDILMPLICPRIDKLKNEKIRNALQAACKKADAPPPLED